MSLKSIYYSVNHILKNKNVNRTKALLNYFIWQLIKIFNFFPQKIKVSNSIIEIRNKKLSLEGGTKIYTQGMYDFNNMSLIKFLLDSGIVYMLDIGTNIGIYSIIASEAITSKVYSFEPHPYTFDILKEQIRLNSRSNIFPINKAVSNSNEMVSFTNDAGSSINKILNQTTGNSIQIESCKISDFCNENRVSPEIVKIDVEGFELDVLQGFGNKLSEVKVFLIEISENHDKVHSILTDHNFDGPYSFDFKLKTFSNYSTSKSIEDPVYLNKNFIQNLKEKFGLKI